MALEVGVVLEVVLEVGVALAEPAMVERSKDTALALSIP